MALERFQVNPRLMERVKGAIRQRVQRVQPKKIAVGITEKKGGARKVDYFGKKQQATVADVAMWMEMGTDTVPERPIMRSYFDANMQRHRREMTIAVRREYKGTTGAVIELGELWAEELRNHYFEANVEPLQKATIASKEAAGLGHPEIPVVATGQVVDAIGVVTR